MSKPNQKQDAPAPENKSPNKGPQGAPKDNSHHKGEGKVVPMPGICMAEGCKQKFQKAGFCMEHFDWFKEGLITKEGQKPRDFNKKYYDYMRRKDRKVA
ncbi:MAG: hypothetical protein IT289_04375 [Oligoflexia bacterium]|nr:hypothetical protein [Oligoflexia bacterium]